MGRSISFQEATALARSGNAEVQYALSRELHQRGKFDESMRWLRLAAAQKLTSAQFTLAICLIDGRHCQRDHQRAIELLQPLAASDIQAAILMSELYGFAVTGIGDRKTGLRYLLGAAQMGDAAALRQLGLLCVCHERWDLVRPLLSASAVRGDSAGAYALACCRAEGIEGPPAPTIDWALLDRSIPQLASALRLSTPKILSITPLIQQFSKVFHPVVLKTLMNLAAPLVTRSQIVDARTGEMRADPMRNSCHVTLGPRQHDHVLEALERCMSYVSGLPVLNGEFIQILRYRVGEEFKPHVDYFNESGASAYLSLAEGGQRVQTLLTYLNDDYSGGSTHFPLLNLTVAGRRGDMLHFHNVSANGLGHKDSLHAGKPVTAGEKWLLSKWIRAEPYPPRMRW
jgi:prolyl 4-hydroxylase